MRTRYRKTCNAHCKFEIEQCTMLLGLNWIFSGQELRHQFLACVIHSESLTLPS